MHRRVNLPEIDFDLRGGLVTKLRGEDVAGKAFLTSENADEYDTYGGIGKTHGSVVRSDNVSGSWVSLHFFEHSDLTGTTQRHLHGLTSAGSFYMIESDGSLVTLDTDRVGEPLASFQYNNRAYYASPSNIPFKVDTGGNVYRHGIKAPGTTQEVKEGFESTSGWTVNSTNSIALSTTVSGDAEGSTNSLSLNKSSTSVGLITITKTGLAQTYRRADPLQLFVFMPSGFHQSVPTSGSVVQVRFGDSGLANADVYRFQVGDLFEGWNLLTFDPTKRYSVVGTSAPSTIDTLEISVYTLTNSTTLSGVLVDQFFQYDAGRPTVYNAGSNGAIDAGAYRYRVAFIGVTGHISNAGPASSAVTIASDSKFYLDEIPVSTDPQVIARRIYREVDADERFLFVEDVPNNVQIGFTDNLAAFYLTDESPFLLGQDVLDHREPPKLRDVAVFADHVFGINAANPFNLEISNVSDPESFPILAAQTFDSALVKLEPHPVGLLVFATDKTFMVQGDSIQNFSFPPVNPEVGVSGRRAATQAKSFPVGLHDQGPYIFNDPSEPSFIGQRIKDIFEDLDSEAFADAFCVHDRARMAIIWFLKSDADSDEYDTILRWSYGKNQFGSTDASGRPIDAFDIRYGTWHKIVLPTGINPLCAATAETEADRSVVYIGCDDGFVYELNATESDDWATALTTTPVELVLETTDAPLGGGRDGRGRPRHLIVAGEFDQSTTLTFTVACRNDAAGKTLSSSSFTHTFDAGAQSKEISIPGMLYGYFARVRIENAESGARPIIKGLRMTYIPRMTHSGPR